MIKLSDSWHPYIDDAIVEENGREGSDPMIGCSTDDAIARFEVSMTMSFRVVSEIV